MSHSVITLLSDLGTRDAAVTVAKATLMKYAPGATIVDLSHNVKQYDLQQAAYLLLSAYKHFAAGAIHIAIVDVYAGDVPRMVLAKKGNHYFIAPDNGILPLAFGTEIDLTLACYELHKPYTFSDWMNNAGKVMELLVAGKSDLPFTNCEVRNAVKLLQPKFTENGIECNILYIDRYENIVLDITKAQFDEVVGGLPFRIILRKVGDITTVSNNYNDVPEGEALCRFNDAGYLEIALNREGIASLLGLGANGIGIRYPTISIFF